MLCIYFGVDSVVVFDLMVGMVDVVGVDWWLFFDEVNEKFEGCVLL